MEPSQLTIDELITETMSRENDRQIQSHGIEIIKTISDIRRLNDK